MQYKNKTKLAYLRHYGRLEC